jgi:acetyl/propionyl-CoA carboxylase alpha subunit/acetyl-CoA carboxylase carboxyltransferase component
VSTVPVPTTSLAGTFRRIAIVNRGEPAVRLIHAVRDLRDAEGAGPRTVALHTHAERAAMFVREADEAVRIGPGPGEPPATGNPYLDHDELIRALVASGADAAWVGWGFVAEDAAFADRCAAAGIAFVGPPGEVMRQLGDKIGAKRLAEAAGVPVAPWSGGAVDTIEDARQQLGHIGLPLVIKATAGGGGRGIRVVREEGDLDVAFERARAEGASAFGDPTVFMEKMVTEARHVEVQIVADGQGGVWAAGVRDCSLQRRNQKVIEESASTAFDARQEADLKRAAADLVRAAGYVGAGTVEFLHRPDDGVTAFLEVNTRLQVEHTVTEMTTDLDLVRLQLHVAAGGRLEGDPPPTRGHAVEARLNAEDPERGFAPASGRIELLTLPTGPGIRVDTGVAEGDRIPPEYDSMIAKIIAWGRDRDEALARLRRALGETTVLIEGGTTNRAFLEQLLREPDVIAGEIDTGWLDRRTVDGGYRFPARPDVALIAAAIDADEAAGVVERRRFFASAARGRPDADTTTRREVDLRYGGTAYRLTVARTGERRYLIESDGTRVVAETEPLRRFEHRLRIGTARHRVVAIRQATGLLVEVDGVPHRITQDDAGLVRAPGPSVVVALTVEVGDVVAAGASVAVLESMKMETVLSAPFAAVVREVLAGRNVQLDTGAPVVRLEAVAEEEDAPAGPVVDLRGLAEADEVRDASRLDAVDALRRLTLGYDIPGDTVADLIAALRRSDGGDAGDEAPVLRAELAVLRIVADTASLSRNRRFGDAEDDEEAHSAREYLHAFLRSLDADAEALPTSFRDKLRRALAHHGVEDLDRTPALEEALFRIHIAQQRITEAVPAVVALLERRLQAGAPTDDVLAAELRETLDRLILATQVRQPVIGDLSRRTRYRCFDQPRLTARREAVHAEVLEQLAALAAGPEDEQRAVLMRSLIDASEPLLPLLEDPSVTDATLLAMLEVLTRRYYRTRDLGEVRGVEVDGRVAVVADFTDVRGRGRVIAVPATGADLDDALRAVGELTVDLPEGDVGAGAVADLYVVWPDAPGTTDELAAGLVDQLDAAGLPAVLRRVTLSVRTGEVPASATDGEGHGVQHLTFRRTPDGFHERRHLRGIHPLIAGRLGLWQFGRFAMDRLPSSDGIYLFHANSREVESDERLFVLAEVRDLTPVRDDRGRVTALPELERVLAAGLDDLRRARATMPVRERPDWNRVQLNVWPVVDVPIGEMDTVVRAIAPTTDGLGIEQVVVNARVAVPDGEPATVAVRMSRPPGQGVTLRVTEPARAPLQPVDETTRKVVKARQRGTVYPYELIPLVRGDGGTGEATFVEHDLDDAGQLVAVDRAPGGNTCGLVVGTVTTPTDRYPEGMTRVTLFGDPTKGLGSIAEAESRRVIAALDLAERLGVPVEWFAVSSGARIAMDSGTENMDWVGRVLRRIIEFTQAGGEINIVVAGINVGAQPYWNAEATMLMHTKGILVMTPDSAMVLTGKQALDYSGGVSAEDNFGIGGYDRVMGPNGQAQHWAPDLAGACDVLFRHYEHTYRAPGERFPRRAVTTDPFDRDVCASPHEVDDLPFTTVGDVFSESANPGRKKPFDIRTVLRAAADQDHPTLERWQDAGDAQIAVVLDAHLGGWPVTLLGIESRPLPRRGFIPADGPEQWTAGTLFPRGSKKVARAVNAASGIRPLVVLANLSGFDGSPESLRELQLEYGAEIGRAVTNFDGPIVFVVISRYHGGAFVVFSRTLNDAMEVAAVEGSHASVIGGPPAAAVVFARDVDTRTARDPRVIEAQERVNDAGDAEVAHLRAELEILRSEVRSEKLGEVAAEFDAIHSIHRAQEVGSVDRIVTAQDLRPYLVDAVERGIARAVAPDGAT